MHIYRHTCPTPPSYNKTLYGRCRCSLLRRSCFLTKLQQPPVCVCMCVCMCVCTHISLVHTHISLVYKHTYIYSLPTSNTHCNTNSALFCFLLSLLPCVLGKYVCMYVCIYVCMYVCMYVCIMYVCMYECMYVCRDSICMCVCCAFFKVFM